MPGTYNFDGSDEGGQPLYVGDSRTVTLAVVDDETPVDYTSGFTFRSEISADRLSATTETAVFEVTAPEAGALSLELTATEAEKLATFVTDPETGQGLAVWDLEVTETATGRVTTLLTGSVTVIGDVSR